MKYDVGGLERTRLDVALESEAVEDPDSKLPLSQYELQDSGAHLIALEVEIRLPLSV